MQTSPKKRKASQSQRARFRKIRRRKRWRRFFTAFSGHFILTLILKKVETEVEVKVEAVVEEISLANYGDFDFVWQGASFLIRDDGLEWCSIFFLFLSYIVSQEGVLPLPCSH